MPRLPDATTFGQRPTPRPAQTSNVGANAVSRAVAEQGQLARTAGIGAMQVGESLGRAGDIAAEGMIRIRTRREAVQQMNAIVQYNEITQRKLLDLSTEADLSNPETADQYSRFLTGERDKLLKAFGGSPDGQAMLQQRLDSVRGEMVSRAATMAFNAQRGKASALLGQELNKIRESVYTDPGSLTTQLRSLDSVIDILDPAMETNELNSFRLGAQEIIAETAIDGLIDRNRLDEAAAMMDVPIFEQVLGYEAETRLREKIIQRQSATTEAASPIGKLAQDFKGGLIDENQYQLGLKSIVSQEGPMSAIGKLRDDLNKGLISEDEYKFGLAQMGKDGLFIRFDENGRLLELSQGPGASGTTGIAPSLAMATNLRLESIDQAKGLVQQVLQQAQKAGVQLGGWAAVKRVFQEAGRLAVEGGEVTTELPILGALVEPLSSIGNELISAEVAMNNIEPKAAVELRSQLTKGGLDAVEATLAYLYARTVLQPDNDRLLQQSINTAKEQTKLFKLFQSEKTTTERLQQILSGLDQVGALVRRSVPTAEKDEASQQKSQGGQKLRYNPDTDSLEPVE